MAHVVMTTTRRSRERLLRDELRRAIDCGEIAPHYQPIVDMRSGRVVRFEALARWTRDGHNVPPSEFIPLAERAGLSAPLRRLIVTHALADARIWRRRVRDLRVSLNLSAAALAQPELPIELLRAVALAGADPSWLAVEITEDALSRDPHGVAVQIDRLRRAGVRIDIDDFGIGYSSLRHLREMRVDSVKIDRQFVGRVLDEHVSRSIVRMVVDLCHEIGIAAVAEGVESPQVWAHLLTAECDEAQGYYIARPMPGDKVDGWVDSWLASPVEAAARLN